MTEQNGSLCLFPECKKNPVNRGLCATHYNAATRYIQLGLTTWDKLVETGRAKASKYPKLTTDPKEWFVKGVKP